MLLWQIGKIQIFNLKFKNLIDFLQTDNLMNMVGLEFF